MALPVKWTSHNLSRFGAGGKSTQKRGLRSLVAATGPPPQVLRTKRGCSAQKPGADTRFLPLTGYPLRNRASTRSSASRTLMLSYPRPIDLPDSNQDFTLFSAEMAVL